MSTAVRRPGRLGRAALLVYALAVTPLLYAATFPMHRAAWLAWFCLAPCFVALRLMRTGSAALACCGVTFLGSYFCTPWLSQAVANYYQQPLLLGIALFAGVWTVTIGPYVVGFILSYRAAARRPAAWLPLLAAAAWAGAEVARARLIVADPFGLFGYSQVEVLPVVQIADLTGVYGISFLLVAVNAALAELGLSYWLGPEADLKTTPPYCEEASPALAVCSRRQAWIGVVLVAVTLAAALTYGELRLHDQPPATATTRVALAQANLDLGSQWRQELYGRNLEEYMRLTVKVLRNEHPQLVIWPESSMTFFLEDEPLYRAALGQLLTSTRTQLIAGGPRTTKGAQERYFNSGFLIAPDGSILRSYDKQRLLPFAEYFPFGGVELLRRQFARVREFTPGGQAALLPTVAGSAGVVICNEVMFGELVGERVRAGAEYLVTLTNDTWLGDVMYAEEAFDMARLRAVEQRRYLLRASTSGPSAFVDPVGRVVERTPFGTATTLVGEVRPLSGSTIYARVGDLFGVLCAIVAVLVPAVRSANSFGARRHHSTPTTMIS